MIRLGEALITSGEEPPAWKVLLNSSLTFQLMKQKSYSPREILGEEKEEILVGWLEGVPVAVPGTNIGNLRPRKSE
jgi:hypothetical protein